MDFASQFQGVLIRAFSPSFSFAVLSLSLSPSISFLPSLSLLPVLAFLPSFLPQVVTSSSGDALRTKKKKKKKNSFQPLPCVFYVPEISQEFAYVKITSRWFEISHHQICLRQPYRFCFSALQARHVRARFECPGTLRPLPSQTGTSQAGSLICRASYSSAVMQSVYSMAPANWAGTSCKELSSLTKWKACVCVYAYIQGLMGKLLPI